MKLCLRSKTEKLIEALFLAYPDLTQKDWAKYLDVSPSQISQWRNGYREMSTDVKATILVFLAVPQNNRIIVEENLRIQGNASMWLKAG